MSRGRGKVQRRLLDILNADDRAFETFELTAQVFGVAPDERGQILVTDAQLVAVRRALQRLACERVIRSFGRGFRDGRRRWANLRPDLVDPREVGRLRSNHSIAEEVGNSPTTVASARQRILDRSAAAVEQAEGEP
jgi:hypothetical protein